MVGLRIVLWVISLLLLRIARDAERMDEDIGNVGQEQSGMVAN
jgi:hypothetical protein